MAVTVISRPLGHKLSTVMTTGQALNSSGVLYIQGDHGLSEGDYIFIDGNIDSYNGFWYVRLDDTFPTTIFYIYEYEDADPQNFVQTAEINFYKSLLDHGWQCVHLPIVYELNTNRRPNTVDTVYLLGGAYSAGTYVNFLAPAISGIAALEYVWFKETISDIGATYQVLSVVSVGGGNNVITINKAYTSSLYSVQTYYNTLHITVNVYGGLDADHIWESEKPFELLAALKLIPDSNGNIKFSISGILKGQIITRNNLTLDTLPNNLDFYTQFYITYSESFDVSDGDEVTTFTSTVVSDKDNFVGHAVNAMLPFKSLNSGHLSDYINEGETLARWLVTQDRPTAYVDRFFDLSFLTNTSTLNLTANIEKYNNGTLLVTEEMSLGDDVGQGVIRVSFLPQSGYDQYCVQVTTSIASPELSSYTNIAGPGPAWSLGSSPSVSLAGSEVSDLLQATYYLNAGTYTFDYSVTLTGPGFVTLGIAFSNGVTSVQTDSINLIAGTNIGTIDITLTGSIDNISFNAANFSAGSRDVEITSFQTGTDLIITESICIDIIDECQSSIVNDNLRLMEGGEFRSLE